jgi:uncharacterized protein (DUF1501 family)
MTTNRREFIGSALRAGAVVSLAPTLPNLFCQAAAGQSDPRGDSILVVVQLSGGNDGLNTVVPYGDDLYYKNRFTLAVGKNAVHKIDDHLGLHPAMEGMSKLYKDGKLSVVQGVGYPSPNRSHFESMDLWHTAHSTTAEQRKTGWLGRYLDAFSKNRDLDLPGVHFGSEKQPLALASERVGVPSLKTLEEFRLDARQDKNVQAAVESLTSIERSSDNDLLEFVQKSTAAAIAASKRLEESASRYKSKASYPATGLAQKLKSVASLINADMPTRVYYVTLDGFDTHSNQNGAHYGLLNELSSAAAAFMADLAQQKQDQRVMVMMFSEFGRRVKENASGGTDHGAAAPVLLVGGKLKGGLLGDHPSLADLDDGDQKFHTDYRQVYATLLEDWLGWKSKEVLGGEFKKLAVVG